MIKQILLLIVTALFCSNIYAQKDSTESEISSDRPGISDSPYLVPRGSFQVETGLNYDFQNENFISNRRYTYNSLLLRIRIGVNFEIRLQNEYNQFQFVNKEANHKTQIRSMSPVSVGYKIKISEEKGIWPAVAFIGTFNLPYTMKKELRPDYIGSNIKFAASNSITDRLGLTYNAGAEWDGITPNPYINYAVCADVNIYKGFSGFLEVYGRISEVYSPQYYFDGGLVVIIKGDKQLDLSGGIIINEHKESGFISAGFSWMLRNPKLSK